MEAWIIAVLILTSLIFIAVVYYGIFTMVSIDRLAKVMHPENFKQQIYEIIDNKITGVKLTAQRDAKKVQREAIHETLNIKTKGLWDFARITFGKTLDKFLDGALKYMPDGEPTDLVIQNAMNLLDKLPLNVEQWRKGSEDKEDSPFR